MILNKEDLIRYHERGILREVVDKLDIEMEDIIEILIVDLVATTTELDDIKDVLCAAMEEDDEY